MKDTTAEDSGAVYVYTRSGDTWNPAAYVKASNTKPAAEFGMAVALNADGKALAVGATKENSAAKGVNGNQADTRGERRRRLRLLLKSRLMIHRGPDAPPRPHVATSL